MLTVEESVAAAAAKRSHKRSATSTRGLANGVKVTMNKAALTEAVRGIAEGLYAMGMDIAAEATANAPRDEAAALARGVPMMADTAFVTVWADGKQVEGPAMPRPKRTQIEGGAVVRASVGEAVLFVGFTSRIAHLQELGTIKMVAHPFLIPALNDQIPSTRDYVLPAMGKRIAAAPDQEVEG